MIGGVEYKLWLDGKPVDEKFYTMIEMVTVEQGIDLATEARLEVEMCATDDGTWSGPSDDYATPWQNLRLEVRNRNSRWTPLIDGPVVSWDATMHGQPGQSTFMLIARDATEYLNREARIETYEKKTDEQLIRGLFERHGFDDAHVHLDDIPKQPKDRPLKHIQRGTDIEMLRSIAEPYDLHVYVVPGDQVNTSEAYVKRLRTTGDTDVPVLVLTGADRNVESCQARNDIANATRYQFVDFDIDRVKTGEVTLTTKWSDADANPRGGKVQRVEPIVQLQGAMSTVTDLKHLGTQILSPYVSAFRNATEVGARAQQRSSYTITVTGQVRAGCYDGVLRAYDRVKLRGVNAKLCTTYIVREVTHTFDRSEHRQDFTLMTNSVAEAAMNRAVPAGVL